MCSVLRVDAIDTAFNKHSRWVLYPHMTACHFGYWAASFDHLKVYNLHAQPSCDISTTARRLPAHSLRRVYILFHTDTRVVTWTRSTMLCSSCFV